MIRRGPIPTSFLFEFMVAVAAEEDGGIEKSLARNCKTTILVSSPVTMSFTYSENTMEFSANSVEAIGMKEFRST